jgi:hypothetical protein
MLLFNEYITGRTDTVPTGRLDYLIESYEWFTTARRVRSFLTGENEPALLLPAMFWPTIPPKTIANHSSDRMPDIAPPPVSPAVSMSDELIDRFLSHDGYRIVPDDSADLEAPVTADRFETPDGDLATEELAAIYLSQGLVEEAKEILRK